MGVKICILAGSSCLTLPPHHSLPPEQRLLLLSYYLHRVGVLTYYRCVWLRCKDVSDGRDGGQEAISTPIFRKHRILPAASIKAICGTTIIPLITAFWASGDRLSIYGRMLGIHSQQHASQRASFGGRTHAVIEPHFLPA